MGGVLALFNGLSLLARIGIIVAGIGGVMVAFYSWRSNIEERAVAETIAGIARNDKVLVDRAWNARQKLRSCEDLGRAWDQTTGECQ